MGVQHSKPSDEIRTIIIGDIEKLVLVLNPNMIVYDLFKMLRENIELISPFETSNHKLDMDDFYVDINNTNYNNTMTLKELGESIILTIRCKYSIDEYLKKKMNKTIEQDEKRGILSALLTLTESNSYGPSFDYDYENNSELSNLIYDKYNNAKLFFDLMELKSKIYIKMNKLETGLQNADVLQEEASRFIENIHMLKEDQCYYNQIVLNKAYERQVYQYNKIWNNKSKLQNLYNKKNLEYIDVKLKIENLMDKVDIIEDEIEQHLKPIENISFFNRYNYTNEWISRGGSWYLKIKNNA
tara:strand:+ start:4424 stop:5320 length:897 start_codon:yes stop_codon:yes gene_type:complete